MKKLLKVLTTLSMFMLCGPIAATALYVTNEAPDPNTIVHVEFYTIWTDAFLSDVRSYGKTPIQFDVMAGKTGFYNASGQWIYNVKITASGPNADKLKIFGLKGEQYVPEEDGYLKNKDTGEKISPGMLDTWHLWAKIVL